MLRATDTVWVRFRVRVKTGIAITFARQHTIKVCQIEIQFLKFFVLILKLPLQRHSTIMKR